MKKIIAIALCSLMLQANAEDMAVKKMPLLKGQTQAYIYLERGPTTGCPEDVPPNDTTNFWQGARLTQGNKNIKLCWYRDDSTITILQPRDGNQLRIDESEFTYFDGLNKNSTQSEPARQTNRNENSLKIADREDKCAIAGMFAEMATVSRDSRQPLTSVYSTEIPWNQISLSVQKNILILVYELPQYKKKKSLEMGVAVHSLCKHDPNFLQ